MEDPKKEKPTVGGAVNHLFHFKNRLETFKNYLCGWKCLSEKTLQLEQVPLLWLQTLWENYSRGLTSLDSVSEKITQEELSPLKIQNVVLRSYSEQYNEKQKNVKNAPCPKKRKHLSYMGVVVASTEKGKVVHKKQV